MTTKRLGVDVSVVHFEVLHDGSRTLFVNGVSHPTTVFTAQQADQLGGAFAALVNHERDVAANLCLAEKSRADRLQSLFDVRDATAAKPTRFEYAVLGADVGHEKLDEYGAEGWELVAANAHGVFLKRVLA